MKKTFLFIILIFLAGHLLEAQPACIKDVEYILAIQKNVVRANKMMEEECFPGNESSPDIWLLRGNIFIQLYEYEIERNERDPKYNIRWPDAIITANESFYKAMELKPDIKGTHALLGPKEGQLLTAAPIDALAAKAMEKRDYNEAIRLLNMVIRSYRVDPKENARNLGYAYIDLSNCYKAIGDEENSRKILLDAAKINVVLPDIYLNLYDLFKEEKDTVKCGEILNQARKVIPDSLAIDVKGYELDYLAMIGNTEKLKEAALKMFEQYKTNPPVINIVAAHLVNNKEYLLADEIIEAGLSIAPNDFDLNQQMSYRYFSEAIDYQTLREERLNEKPRNTAGAEEARIKMNEILETALIWAEKTYNINQNDVQHNKMYNQILVRLVKPIPEDLNEKINSYNKQ